ncbi:hypothetical protein MRX96_027160 [Rhipicephalus microplus]
MCYPSLQHFAEHEVDQVDPNADDEDEDDMDIDDPDILAALEQLAMFEGHEDFAHHDVPPEPLYWKMVRIVILTYFSVTNLWSLVTDVPDTLLVVDTFCCVLTLTWHLGVLVLCNTDEFRKADIPLALIIASTGLLVCDSRLQQLFYIDIPVYLVLPGFPSCSWTLACSINFVKRLLS